MDELICPVRKKEVAATPEERVRASFLTFLLQKGFPKELILVESPLRDLPHLQGKIFIDRRVDILCYTKTLKPLLLVECKRKFKLSHLSQLLGYNHIVGASFIALVSSGIIEMRRDSGAFCLLEEFPSFSNLNSL